MITTARDLRALIETRETISQLTWLEGAVSECERLHAEELKRMEAEGQAVDWTAHWTMIEESRALCAKLRQASGVVE